MIYQGTEDVTIFGNIGNDTITAVGVENGHGGWIVGGGGKDTLTGSGANEVFVIEQQSDIVAGEIYDGAGGIDALWIETSVTSLDLSAVTVTGLEDFSAGLGINVTMTAAQLDQFTRDILPAAPSRSPPAEV